MVDTAFDDFLDSDDDAFFLEASNHLLDYDVISESAQIKETNVSQKQSEIVTSGKSQAATSVENLNNVSDTNKISSNECENFVKHKNVSIISSETPVNSKPDCKISPSEFEDIKGGVTSAKSDSNKTQNCCRTPSKEYESINKAVIVTTTSSGCNTSSVFPNLFKTSTPAISAYINSRFTPGFTPKAKKRKLPGPAGFLELFDESKETVPGNSHKMLTMNMEFENIVSSQYTPEHLSLSSWQKLQTAVSSCSNLHSTAKYYSIQRVLQESSKKKLPKHMVVPVLCVLLKKLSNKGSATISVSVFMDDTGEINGKIDTEVLSAHKEFLVEGTALILKKVTFLCNMLILKSQNLVSMYHPDGTEKHPQSLESILETPEPLKPMNCECLKLSHVKNSAHKTSHYNTSVNHTSGCLTHSQNRLNNSSNQNKTVHKIPQNNNTPYSYKVNCNSQTQSRSDCISNQKTLNNSISSLNSKQSLFDSQATSHSKSMRSDAFLENLLDEDNCMDEFDELLGNLDEKSFLEDV